MGGDGFSHRAVVIEDFIICAFVAHNEGGPFHPRIDGIRLFDLEDELRARRLAWGLLGRVAGLVCQSIQVALWNELANSRTCVDRVLKLCHRSISLPPNRPRRPTGAATSAIVSPDIGMRPRPVLRLGRLDGALTATH